MGKQVILKVGANDRITKSVNQMVLFGDTSACTRPGQFVNLLMNDVYLRRPISVCDFDENTITLVFRKLGKGTEMLAQCRVGETLNALVGMGNGYWVPENVHRPLVIGGGLGTPPMYALTKMLLGKGLEPTVLLGFRTKDDIFYEQNFKDLGARTIVITDDGSYGEKAMAADYVRNMEGSYDYFYACGPIPMLKTLYEATITDGQMSGEERMGCGFGACMGCSTRTKFGNKRICKDGPVLTKEEIIWKQI